MWLTSEDVIGRRVSEFWGAEMQGSFNDRKGARVVAASQTPRPPEPDSVQDHCPENLRQRAVRGGILTLAVRLTAQVVTWLAMFVVIRLISPADYGLIVTAALLLNLALVLAEAGMVRALVQKKRVTHAEMAVAFTVTSILSGGLYLTAWSLSGPIAQYLGAPDLASLLRFMALFLFLVPLKTIAAASLKRQLRFGTICAAEAVAVVVQSGILLLLAIQGYGVWAFAWSFICGRILETAQLWYASGCTIALRKPSADNVELFRYGLTITASSLVWYLFESADVAVISAVLGQATLGYYAVVLLIVKAPLEKLSAAINQIVFATFCKLQNDRQRMRSWFIRLLVLQLLVVCPALIGLALVADIAVPLLLGEKWQSVVLPLRLLAPVGVLLIISSSFAPFFNAIGRPDITFKYDFACAASLLIAFFAVSHFFGLVGVCLVWLTLYPLLIAVMIQITRSVTTITVADLIRATAPVLLGTIFMGVVVSSLRYFLPDAMHPSLQLATLIAGGVLSYSVWVLAFAREMILANILVLQSELGWRRSAVPAATCRTGAASSN